MLERKSIIYKSMQKCTKIIILSLLLEIRISLTDHNKINFNEGSLNYMRFVTHFKFFGYRLFSHTIDEA